MFDIQTSVSAPVELIVNGGPRTVTELLKGTVVNGAERASRDWQALFSSPESGDELKLAADRVARSPLDAELRAEVEALVERLVGEAASGGRIEATMSDVKSRRSVVVNVMTGGSIDIENKR